VVWTHSEALEDSTGRTKLEFLKAKLCAFNPAAPQFAASTRLLCFSSGDGKASLLPAEMPARCVAFCGVGSPSHFFQMLRRAGVTCVAHRFFSDHHRYSEGDVQAIEDILRKSNAECVITTEKDLVNLAGHSRFSVPLYWADIVMEIAEEEALLAWLTEKLQLSLKNATPAGRSWQPELAASTAAPGLDRK
jgi:tetraacyldisaccharide-1-P 4'-kinase